MAGYTCPFCRHDMALSSETFRERRISFESSEMPLLINPSFSTVTVMFYKCPNCEETSIRLRGNSTKISNIELCVSPQSAALQYPEYVPLNVRQDYEEACAIVSLSPKASATLSRRCLQSMIRDFWGIKKKRLIDEIDALKDHVRPSQWKVIDAIRTLGNIGAHPEADTSCILDIDPDDAQKLLRVIESLIDKWYIARHEEEELYGSVSRKADDKKAAKHEVK